MNRLSSQMTFFYKRIFPFIWFGFLALLAGFTVLAPMSGHNVNGPPPAFLAALALMGVFGYFMMRKIAFDLVDEVLDAGDALVVRNGSVEDHIALSNIINVSYTQFTNPPRATLTLRSPSRLGEKITFCPTHSMLRLPFSNNPVIEDLIKRVDAARRGAR
jgi:hypothetical protein